MANGRSYFHCRPRTRRKQNRPDILEEKLYTFEAYPCHGSRDMLPRDYRWFSGSALVILTVLTILCDTVSANSRDCTTRVGACWDRYQINDQNSNKDSNLNRREFHCAALRTYMHCLEKLIKPCTGKLDYHTAKRLVHNDMMRDGCPKKGPEIVDGHPPVLPPDDLCAFKGRKVYKHCGLFGDPHLKTFNNKLQTCRVKGAWPLVNNKHFTVQVTNDPVSNSIGATATSKLTVIIKKNVVCASNRYISYQAQSGYLPATFDDGQTYFGKSHSVELEEKDPGKHVEIKLKYIDTIIVIRQVGVYFTFALKMPEELLNSSESITQLCVHGCPKSELIDYERVLASKEEKLTSTKVLMSRDDAYVKCRKAGLRDFFLDTCVFDLMMTGNDTFAEAARYAFRDIQVINPNFPSTQANRTHLPEFSNSGSGVHRTSGVLLLDIVNMLVLTCVVCCLNFHWTTRT